MPQEGEDWVAVAIEAAKAACPIDSSVAEDLKQRLQGTMVDHELTKAEQIQVAKSLIALVRNPPNSRADNEA